MAKSIDPAQKSSKSTEKLKAPQTRNKNDAGQTNGQFEMNIKERGKSQDTSAGGAPKQVY